jgi:NitT/TauT family transport system substrate-binding protein
MRRRTLIRLAAAAPLWPLARASLAQAADGAIRFITVHSEQGATAVFADRAGFFKQAGLDIDVELLGNGASVLAAVVGGTTTFGVSNPVSLAVAHQRGVPLVAFAPTAYYTRQAPSSLLLVAPHSPIRSGKDLDGKTIAVNGLRNTPQFATEAWIEKTGGDPKTVNFIEMPYAEMAAALNAGRVEAAFCAEPALSQARATTRVLADTYAAIAPRFLTGVYITTIAYAKANPDVVERVAEALRKTAAWANAHPNETAEITSEVAKIDLATVRHMVRARYAERLTPEDVQPPIDVAARYGLLTHSFPASELIWQGR